MKSDHNARAGFASHEPEGHQRRELVPCTVIFCASSEKDEELSDVKHNSRQMDPLPPQKADRLFALMKSPEVYEGSSK